jgi:hypothetical protein
VTVHQQRHPNVRQPNIRYTVNETATGYGKSFASKIEGIPVTRLSEYLPRHVTAHMQPIDG